MFPVVHEIMSSNIEGESVGSTVRSGVNLALSFTSCATLSKLFNFSNPVSSPVKWRWKWYLSMWSWGFKLSESSLWKGQTPPYTFWSTPQNIRSSLLLSLVFCKRLVFKLGEKIAPGHFVAFSVVPEQLWMYIFLL